MHRTLRHFRWAGVLACGLLLAACGQGASTGTGSAITVGTLFPLTGGNSAVGSWLQHGTQVGVDTVNRGGGVMGRRLNIVWGDDVGDPADAVPAFRKVIAQNPTFMVGPNSVTAPVVINQFDGLHLPDFIIGGSTAFDNMNYPYVYRPTPSDSTQGAAMAYYAAKTKGLLRGALLFDNTSAAQTLVQPIINAYKKLGGQIVANIQFVPLASSYQSEIAKLDAANPTVIFVQTDPQSATTLFTQMEQLGGIKAPIIGTDTAAAADFANAMGCTQARQYLTAMEAASPQGPANTEFVKAYKLSYPGAQILPLSDDAYDSVVISALAMTAAKSTDPRVWNKYVLKVANPPGVVVNTYKEGVAALKAGKEINYQGAGGPQDFNAHHNTQGNWDAGAFQAGCQSVSVTGTVTAADIANL